MTDKNTLFSCILHECSLPLHGNVSPQARGDRESGAGTGTRLMKILDCTHWATPCQVDG